MAALRRVSRRRFLLLGSGLAAAFAFRVGWRFQRGTCQNLIRSVVRRRLPYLKITDGDVQRFVEDYEKNMPSRKAKRFAALSGIPGAYPMLLRKGHPDLVAFEEGVSGTLLLSTDLFLQGANPENPVKYLGLYDPHAFACSNPFADLSHDG